MSHLITKILSVLVLTTVTLSASINSPDFEASANENSTLANALRVQAANEFRGDEYEKIILEYIEWVIDDGILENPKEYFTAWRIKRGNTRELRMPEDYALYFFSKYLL